MRAFVSKYVWTRTSRDHTIGQQWSRDNHPKVVFSVRGLLLNLRKWSLGKTNLATLVGFSFEYSDTCPLSSFETMQLCLSKLLCTVCVSNKRGFWISAFVSKYVWPQTSRNHTIGLQWSRGNHRIFRLRSTFELEGMEFRNDESSRTLSAFRSNTAAHVLSLLLRRCNCVQASFYVQFVFQTKDFPPVCNSIVSECLWAGCYSFVICFLFSKDWHSEALPEKDLQGFYNTSLPVFLFKMIDQNVSRF